MRRLSKPQSQRITIHLLSELPEDLTAKLFLFIYTSKIDIQILLARVSPKVLAQKTPIPSAKLKLISGNCWISQLPEAVENN